MKKDFHLELIFAILEPELAQMDYLDNLREETKLSKVGFIAKLKDAYINIFRAFKTLELEIKERAPGIHDITIPYLSFFQFPHLKLFATQFIGPLNEGQLKTLEDLIYRYELRILEKDILKSFKKLQKSAKGKDPQTNGNGEEIENKFNQMPIEEVRSHFLPLIQKKNPKGQIWMSASDFEIFLKRSFGMQTDLSKPKINLVYGGKHAIVKLFFGFYEKCQNENFTQNRNKIPFIELLKNSFDTNWFDDLTNDNFKKDKSKYEWD